MSPAPGGEDAGVERPALKLLSELGWETASGFAEKPGELGRQDMSEPILKERLRDSVVQLNPGLDDGAIEAALDALIQDRSSLEPVRANKAVWELLRDGISVHAINANGRREPRRVRFIDWNVSENNEWLAVSQLWMLGDMYKRRADIILFVNGIPLGFLEFKAPNKSVHDAYQDNLRAYRAEIPQLFWFNAFVILSNGSESRMGSTYAPWEHFAEWKKIDDETEPGIVSLETMLRATCVPQRMLDLVENFIVYTERPGELIKAVAKNHQYLGVNNAIEALYRAKERDGRLGVFWHTQGSGKSLSMLWFTQKVLRRRPGNWTFVLVTDRRELDEQLYEEFADSGVITAGTRVHADSSAHLRQLLGEDQRYVFTLIHKFIPPVKGGDMPVLSDRDDIIVITDEAHRSQYDTLAGNMRAALPNASFLGFTGTPLIEGEEEETRRVFGDYVSTYNFADSIRDGATVPLYYENRIPELQLTNENFDTELEDLLEEASLDEAQEKAVSRRFSQQYQLITRPKRLQEIAVDLVNHFANRGFLGKGMYVAIDKATAVRMYDLVSAEWAKYILKLEARLETLPELEKAPVRYQIRWMRETDMAVVVSQAQNEIADMAGLGLDIAPHRRKMIDEELDSRFKDSADPFRLVFVCAMWLTGFDAPSNSTIYLDKPMRGHTLMQTIARANRVFPEKESGLIVDYIGVFRNLERALAIYGAGPAGADSPIQPTDELRDQLVEALNEVEAYLDRNDVEFSDLEAATGFEYVALQDSAVEALLIDEATRKGFVSLANRARKIYKSLMPDPAALNATKQVTIVRSLANKIASANEVPDIGDFMDGVAALLDRSVGAREYIIRAMGEEQSLLDLNKVDWEQLALEVAGNERTAVHQLRKALEPEVERAVRKNPTLDDLADRFRQLISDYNAGTLNAEETVRRFAQIHGSLDSQQQRVVEEGLSEAELALFDLLTKPAPQLTDAEFTKVRMAAKSLLQHIEDRLVLDWKKKESSRASVRVAIRNVLDQELPEAYGPELFDDKRQLLYAHFYSAFGNEGESIYDELSQVAPVAVETLPNRVEEFTERQVEASKTEQLAEVLEHIYGVRETWARTLEDIMAGEETDVIEFKTSARWDVHGEVTKLAPAVIMKTISGFANRAGGTLLIGVNDSGEAVGLTPDYETFNTAQDIDAWLGWMTDKIVNDLGRSALRRLRVRIHVVDGKEICRIDIPASSAPFWCSTGKGKSVLFERLPNSTRAVPDNEVQEFLAERFPDHAENQ